MIAWLTAMATAGTVCVNGVNIEALRNQSFDNVKVTIDAAGNILIDAPNYRIEVQGGASSVCPVGQAPTTATTYGQTTTTTYGQPPATTYTASQPTAAPPATVTSASSPQLVGIGPGRYWLVSEDNGSRGHVIEVYVNGQLVAAPKSGDPQMILDLGAWMRTGNNTIRMVSSSQNASGGSFNVYIGTGRNESGTVTMDPPQVQYGVGSTRTGQMSRDYQLVVQ